MVDRVRPLVMESPLSGGTQLDFNPVEVDPTQDGVDARAFFAQSGTSADSTAFVSRTGADLTLTDANAGTKKAQDLVSRVLGSSAYHSGLADLVHYVGAPGDNYTTPFFVPTYTGPLLTQRAWYTSSGQTQLIFKQTLTYTGALIATVVSVVYTSTGAISRTLTETYSYYGPIVASIARSWT